MLVPHLTPTDGPADPGRSDKSWLAWERDLLGMYLSDHPLRRIAATLQERVDTSINELGPHLDGLVVQVGGCIRDVRAFVPRKSTTGQRMAFLQIEDLTGACEVVVFNRVFEEVAELLRPDAVVVIRGKVEVGRQGSNGAPAIIGSDDEERDSEPAKIRADAIFALDEPDWSPGDATARCTFAWPATSTTMSPACTARSLSTPVICRWSSTSRAPSRSTTSRLTPPSRSSRARPRARRRGSARTRYLPRRDEARSRPRARDLGCRTPRLIARTRRWR